MKKQISVFRLFILCFGVLFFTNTFANNAQYESHDSVCFDNIFTYSWAADSNANSYTLEIINQSNSEVFSWTVNTTSVSAFSVPSGTYDLKLTGHTSSGSSFIITEEIIQH